MEYRYTDEGTLAATVDRDARGHRQAYRAVGPYGQG
jgi:hypothetical protein